MELPWDLVNADDLESNVSHELSSENYWMTFVPTVLIILSQFMAYDSSKAVEFDSFSTMQTLKRTG